MRPSLCGPSTIRRADPFPALNPHIGKNFPLLNHAKTVTACILDRDFGWLEYTRAMAVLTEPANRRYLFALATLPEVNQKQTPCTLL
jgi:hypothetical protein